MYWHLTPYTIPFLVSTLVSISLGVYIWANRHKHPGATTFSLLNLSLGEWSLALALQSVSTSLDAALLWNNTAQLGFVALPGLWYVSMIRFVRPNLSLKARHVALICIFPVVLLLLMLTNNEHRLFQMSAALETSGEFSVLRVQYGPAFWAFMGYMYVLVLAPVIPLLRYALRGRRWQQPKLLILAVLAFLPWLGSTFNLLSPYHYPSLDVTPLLLTLIGLTIAWGVPYFQLLQIVPQAREKIIDQMDNGIIVLGTNLNLVDINPAAVRLLGVEHNSAIGKDAQALLQPLGIQLKTVLHNGPIKFELAPSEGKAHAGVCEIKAGMLTDSRGQAEGWLLTIQNISEREHTQQVLQNATASAEAAVRVKDEFMANMSHELRTPLNSIIGYATLMSQGTYGELTEAQTDRLDRILESSKQLLEILNNILDLSRIEADGLAIECRPINLSMLMKECLAVIEPLAVQKGLSLANEVADDVPLIDADYHRLHQVLINLLSNAVKFTNEGTITVRARAGADPTAQPVPARDARNWVTVEVRDTGIGISADSHEVIFEAFRQIDSSSTRSYQGTGLGLSIARKLVEIMGGRIWVESQPGAGSSFFLLLPQSETQIESDDKIGLAAFS